MSANDGQSLRVATYNVHGCRGMDRRRSEERIAEVIASLEVDVIGLQELDLNRRRSAGAQTGTPPDRFWKFEGAPVSSPHNPYLRPHRLPGTAIPGRITRHRLQ